MSVLKSHLVLMFFYAVAAGVFFAFLWREEKRDRIKLFLVIFGSLFVGGIALAWLMYPFPLR
jgi:hypothetical protein